MPSLLSWLQQELDERADRGAFILAGSNNFLLLEHITQTLVCHLLRIRDAATLATHASRGALFENLIVVELLKQRFHAGQRSNLYFWRDHTGHELDLVIDEGTRLIPVEIKSGRTISEEFVKVCPSGAS